MKASDYIAQLLVAHNISHVFGYIGGMVAHLTDSIFCNHEIEMINSIHEQGAGFAAEGYARVTGKTGVAIATSGPGATNLLTPIASCFFDSTPVLFITGQVNTFEYKKFPKIRQCGFQETNIVDIARPITKYAVKVDCIENLRYELEKCLFLAQDGRKGSVLLDLPMDIQRADFDFENAKSFVEEKQEKLEDLIDLSYIIKLLREAERPLVLVGNGARLSGACREIRTFLEKTKFPVVESLLGLDIVSSDYKYNLGMIGTYGNRYGNIAFSMADVVLVLGSRLDLRQIGTNLKIFDKTKIIQVDIDEEQLNCDNLDKITIRGSVKSFMKELLAFEFSVNEKWLKKVLSLKGKYPSIKTLEQNLNLPNAIINSLSKYLNENDVVCTDVGQHQMWAGQSLFIKSGTRHLSSGGLGAMGFSLPAAIGSAISGCRSIVISGDGGFQMNIQELEVIKRRNLPVKIIVMNNHNLGMVRQFQDMYFAGRNPSTVNDYSAPDFSKIAQAYGIFGITKQAEELTESFWNDFFNNDDPALLNICLEKQTQIQPKVLFGNSIDNMHPLLSEEELKSVTERK